MLDVKKHPVECFCFHLEKFWTRLAELGENKTESDYIYQAIGNLHAEYNIQVQLMKVDLAKGKLAIPAMEEIPKSWYKDLKDACWDNDSG